MIKQKAKWRKTHTQRLLKLIGLLPVWLILLLLEGLIDSILYLFELIHQPILKAKKSVFRIMRRHIRSIKSVLKLEGSDKK